MPNLLEEIPNTETETVPGPLLRVDRFVAQGRGTGVPKGSGQVRVRTSQMSGGYLRRHGVPYSENASLDEYFDTFTEPNGDTWLIVTSITTDPRYLTQPYTSTVPFKKIPDRQGWDPTPCKADEAR